MTVPANIDHLLLGAKKQDYLIQRSVTISSAAANYLNRTPASVGDRKTFTVSAWVKRTGILFSAIDVPLLSAGDGTNFGISGTGALGATYDGRFYIRNGGANLARIPTPLFRDPTAWYHIVFSIDTTNATAADRQIVYVNGIRQENFDSSFSLNADTNINTTTAHTIGVGLVTTANSTYTGNFYLTEYYFIDGQALTPSSFGETDAATGVWKPKAYGGTYGTNGFYLNFSDNSTTAALGTDYSGNGHNWSLNGFTLGPGATNYATTDVPTLNSEDAANYLTLGQLRLNGTYTIRFGDMQLLSGTSAMGNWLGSTPLPTTGKWYLEITKYTTYGAFGFSDNLSAALISTPGSGGGGGSVYGVAWDMDAGKVWIGTSLNNSDIESGLNPTTTFTPGTTYYAFARDAYVAQSTNGVYNYGQMGFINTPPSGFKNLNTYNFPDPSITKPSQYTDLVTYTGTGSTLTPTSSLEFSPDLVWIKSRSAATDHALYDAVRGATFQLESNTTTAETTEATGLTAFNSNGFTVGALAQVNTNAATYVAWCWDESTTPGFDIVSYTGDAVSNRAIGHGLGVTPAMIIVKDRDVNGSNDNWFVWHEALGGNYNIDLNATAARYVPTTARSGGGIGADGVYVPNSTDFTLRDGTVNNQNLNESGDRYIAYLWSEVAGFSEFGSYTGNANANGPFVWCNFQPAILMIKRIDSTSDWTIIDTQREGYNVDNDPLFANLNNVEGTTDLLDLFSHGFKIRTTDASVNASAGTYIYAAFAKTPFKYSLAR